MSMGNLKMVRNCSLCSPIKHEGKQLECCMLLCVWIDWWRGGLDSVQSEPRQRDVYLGGSCGQSRWRDDVAIPVLLYVL